MHSSTSSSDTPAPIEEKTNAGTTVETVHTNERVPGHPGYYEKGGLRTYGDDEDHDHEPPVSCTPPEKWFSKRQQADRV